MINSWEMFHIFRQKYYLRDVSFPFEKWPYIARRVYADFHHNSKLDRKWIFNGRYTLNEIYGQKLMDYQADTGITKNDFVKNIYLKHQV